MLSAGSDGYSPVTAVCSDGPCDESPNTKVAFLEVRNVTSRDYAQKHEFPLLCQFLSPQYTPPKLIV